MKNVLFNIKSVITGSSKAVAGAGAGAGAETFWKSELERKKIVSAPQPCPLPPPAYENLQVRHDHPYNLLLISGWKSIVLAVPIQVSMGPQTFSSETNYIYVSYQKSFA